MSDDARIHHPVAPVYVQEIDGNLLALIQGIVELDGAILEGCADVLEVARGVVQRRLSRAKAAPLVEEYASIIELVRSRQRELFAALSDRSDQA
jgi:hypothetical protein